jgi:UDP-glucose 4-epimerase
MGKTVLITGANGFVGKNLVHVLAQDKDLTIIATDIHSSLLRLDENICPDVTYVSGDLASKELAELLRNKYKFDYIIHLAAILSQAEDMSTYFSVMDSNIYTTFLLLETARAHNTHIILPSTALVYGNKDAPFTEELSADPEVFYAMSKYMSEELIRFYHRKYSLNYLIFRIGIFYGPGQLPSSNMFIPSLIAHLLEGKEFAMTAGEQVRDFVYISDFVELIRNALQKPDLNGLYNVGTGHAPTLKETALLVEKLTNTSGLLRLGAMPYRKEEVWNYCLDNSKTRSAFDWEPLVGLEQGLQQTIDYQKKSHL